MHGKTEVFSTTLGEYISAISCIFNNIFFIVNGDDFFFE